MALKGNQKKLDRNNNNRIDAQDFKILKAEKAKGRGQGLQDEKMKPGKPMKAKRGQFMGKATKYKKYLKGLKAATAGGGKGSGTGGSDFFNRAKRRIELMDPEKTTNLGNPRKKGDPFLERRFNLAGAKSLIGKAGRLGAVGTAIGVAAVGAKKLMDKIKENKKKKTKGKMGGGLAAATERLKAQGKMGGGMMMRPMGYKSGKSVKVKCKLGRNKPTKLY